MMRRAVFAGTFDPFTNGHLDIVRRASFLFDEVIILFADNDKKQRLFNKEGMMDAVTKFLQRNEYHNVFVDSSSGLTANYCRQHGIKYLIRGLRNVTDYLYEEEIASVNSMLNGKVETIYIRGKNSAISSSIVRAMISNGNDYIPYVPRDVYELITSSN